jgi:hypothetical protein
MGAGRATVQGIAVVLQGLAGDHGDRDQPVPAQLGAGLKQRRLVQPAPYPLRPLQAGLHEDGPVARRHRPRHVPQVNRCSRSSDR